MEKRFKIGDKLIYIGDNEEWKSMLDIHVYDICDEHYIVIYNWYSKNVYPKPRIKHGLAEFAFDESMLKEFVPKTKAGKVLYEKKI